MPIKLNVPYADKDRAKSLGAWWNVQEKVWVVPDSIDDINPFREWLPKIDGMIVKWPYVVVRSHRACWKCGKDTPLIALGARRYYYINFEPDIVWYREEDGALLFLEIDVLDLDFVAALQEKYPFFKLTYSKSIKAEYFANTCTHCGALQGDNYNFMESNMIFCFDDPELVRYHVKRDYLKLKFDYFISSAYLQAESNEWVLA